MGSSLQLPNNNAKSYPCVSEKVGPTQRTLTKVNHKVTQRTKLIHDLPQTRCVLRCRVKSSCSEPDDMCVCSVLSTDLYFQVRQARRRYTRLRTAALINQLKLRLIKCPDYPQPPIRGTPATMQFTRMTLSRPSCSSHRLEVGYSDNVGTKSGLITFLPTFRMGSYP
jgi:hypothetical protein